MKKIITIGMYILMVLVISGCNYYDGVGSGEDSYSMTLKFGLDSRGNLIKDKDYYQICKTIGDGYACSHSTTIDNGCSLIGCTDYYINDIYRNAIRWNVYEEMNGTYDKK